MTTGPLRVAVVGGGITGLTVAAALSRAGLSCRLFEQTAHLREVGAGIQLSPNGSLVLHRLGLGRRLSEVAVRPRAIEVRRWADDDTLARTVLGADCERLFGAPYYTLHRADLHRELLALLPEGVVHLGHRCTGVVEHGRGVRLTFDNGVEADADVVIGADGIRSRIRGSLRPQEAPRPSGHSVYRAVVPAEAVPGLAADPRVVIWMGPGQHCVCYPISGGTRISLAASTPGPGGGAESWSGPASPAELRQAYAGWNASAQALFAAVEDVTRWALHDRPPVTRWSSRRTTLAGDAAHPMLPFGAQGASQGLEDAAVLAACLAAAAPGTVPAALRRYERLRRPRTERVQRFVQANEREHHVGEGTPLARRDARMSRDFDLRSREWLFGYDAGRAAPAVAS